MSERRARARWTAEEDAHMTRLYAEGLTYAAIAERLGCAKGKVAGRLDRLRLTGKRPAGRTHHVVRTMKPGPKPKAKQKLNGAARGRQPVAKLPVPAVPAPEPPVIKVPRGRPAENRHTPAPHPSARTPRPSDLIWRPTTCQFPSGDPKEPGFHFCGASITPDGRSYCDSHAARCYLSPKKAPGDGPATEFQWKVWGGRAA